MISIVNKHCFVPLWPLSSIHRCPNIIIIIRKGASSVFYGLVFVLQRVECIRTKWSNILLSALLLGYRAGDSTQPAIYNGYSIVQVHFALANSNISYSTIIAGRLFWHSTAHNRC